MVRLATFEEWQKQSSLLLQARPSTARITTKYNVPNLADPKYNKPPKAKPSSSDATATDTKSTERIPRATITLKTHDTASGVVLKFKTDRAADVSRLFTGLGSLGRHMAALPEKAEDVEMTTSEAPTDSALTSAKSQPQPQQQQGQTSGGAGGKKKKKGKR